MDADSHDSPHSAHPGPCEACQYSTCFALHNYSPKGCPLKTCSECTELEGLDLQILEVHNLLVNLSKKRRQMKERINIRHDRLIERLPIEVVSMIFRFVDESESVCYVKSKQSYVWTPSLVLGGVCRRWREITLNTPQLWSEITIDPWKDALFLDITAHWLSRSRALPLSLTIRSKPSTYAQVFAGADFANLMQLLRSHIGRWTNLDLRVPSEIIHGLFNGLEDMARLDILRLDNPLFDTGFEDEVPSIEMKGSISPTYLFARHIDLASIPLQWDALTHLDALGLGIDTLIHIFRHATQLQACTTNGTKADEGHYPLPTSPVTSHLDRLDTRGCILDVDLLHHLNLPSLKSLKYVLPRETNRDVLAILADFIERSQPRLRRFAFHYNVFSAQDSNDWYHMFPTVTHLVFDIELPFTLVNRIEEYIRGLGAYMNPLAFPHLQELYIKALEMSPLCWSLLGEIFPDDRDDQPAPKVTRPLKLLQIYQQKAWDNLNEQMDEASRLRLEEILESGVEILTYDSKGTSLIPPHPMEDMEDEDTGE